VNPAHDVDADELLLRVGRGDRVAFDVVYRIWAPRLGGFFRVRGLAAHDADELAQDVLAVVWRQAHRFDPDVGSAPAWMFTIARNRWVDRHRHHRRIDPDPEDPMYVADDAASPESIVASRRAARAVTDAIDRLPTEQRAVLVDGQLAGRSLAEVASSSGLPLGTVKTRARLAIEHLRRALRGVA
jgi:RNA polymerase sigma-70 factor (ECF subfamily)